MKTNESMQERFTRKLEDHVFRRATGRALSPLPLTPNTKPMNTTHTPGHLVLPLYAHTTEGGAEYLTNKYADWAHEGRSGREGIFEGADISVRLDGQPEIRLKGIYAAAPDLLAALEQIEYLTSGAPTVLKTLINDKCRALIARAKGQA